jgi:hypothetical protein
MASHPRLGQRTTCGPSQRCAPALQTSLVPLWAVAEKRRAGDAQCWITAVRVLVCWNWTAGPSPQVEACRRFAGMVTILRSPGVLHSCCTHHVVCPAPRDATHTHAVDTCINARPGNSCLQCFDVWLRWCRSPGEFCCLGLCKHRHCFSLCTAYPSH